MHYAGDKMNQQTKRLINRKTLKSVLNVSGDIETMTVEAADPGWTQWEVSRSFVANSPVQWYGKILSILKTLKASFTFSIFWTEDLYR